MLVTQRLDTASGDVLVTFHVAATHIQALPPKYRKYLEVLGKIDNAAITDVATTYVLLDELMNTVTYSEGK